MQAASRASYSAGAERLDAYARGAEPWGVGGNPAHIRYLGAPEGHEPPGGGGGGAPARGAAAPGAVRPGAFG